jgi:hypothetical protein
MTGPDLAPRTVRLNHQLRQDTKDNGRTPKKGKIQCCGSGLDIDSMESLDPDSQLGSGFARAKMTHNKGKNLINLIFLSAVCFLLRAGQNSFNVNRVPYPPLGTHTQITISNKEQPQRKPRVGSLPYQYHMYCSKLN